MVSLGYTVLQTAVQEAAQWFALGLGFLCKGVKSGIKRIGLFVVL